MIRFCTTLKVIAKLQFLIFAALLLTSGGAAQSGAPLEARLTFDKATFNLGDPGDSISAVVTLLNKSGEPVLTQGGFGELGYHLYLYFLGPEPYGSLITSTDVNGGSAPSPTVPPPRVAAEWLPYDWLKNMTIDEMRNFYPLTLPGKYKVWFKMTFVQYDPNKAEAFDTESDGIIDGYKVPYDAIIWSEPLESSPPVYITLTTATSEIQSDIRVEATEFIYNEDDKKGVTRKPMEIEVRLYRTLDIINAGVISDPINQKDYGDIVTNSLIQGYRLAEQTKVPGEYIYKNIPKDDYIVIGYASRVTDYKHLGSIIETEDENWGNGEIFVNIKLQTGKDKKDKKK
ncbi:MAG: hypothetical protein PVI00_07980 [Desulfobacterales bacterium]|jgi:hypothetical protein